MSYTIEIDQIKKGEWDRLLLEFDDATIFQSWAYGSARWGEGNLSHVVIKHGGEIVGLAQSVLAGVPLLGKMFALVICGPLWQRRGTVRNVEHLRFAISALREQYVVRGSLCLRLRPWPYDFPKQIGAAMIADGSWRLAAPSLTTYILDLSPSEEEIRRAMDKKWRANLRKAEQCDLRVTQQSLRGGVTIFVKLHKEMRDRKRAPSNFIGALLGLCEHMPEELEPRVFVCWRRKSPVASAIVSATGNRAFYVNGASGDCALEVRGGYFLQWEIVRWLKENSLRRWYDLHGVLPSGGVRQFKKGLVGPKAEEVCVDEFEACESQLAKFVVRSGSRLKERYSNCRLWKGRRA